MSSICLGTPYQRLQRSPFGLELLALGCLPALGNLLILSIELRQLGLVAQTASMTTGYGRPWSTRQFVVNYREFEAIATAPLVKMMVSLDNS